MLWLTRPPYLRWFAAGAIVLAAMTWDLSKRQTEPFPFAMRPIPAGSPITADAIEWRPVAQDSVPQPVLDGVTAGVDIETGDPLTRSVLVASPPLPEGWWAVPVDLPRGLPAGATVRVIFPDGSGATGIVTQPGGNDEFGMPSPGTVGFPQAIADTVAQLASAGNLVLLVEP